MATKYFECEHCDSEGKIIIKTNDLSVDDIVYCPICGGDIYDEDEDLD